MSRPVTTAAAAGVALILATTPARAAPRGQVPPTARSKKPAATPKPPRPGPGHFSTTVTPIPRPRPSRSATDFHTVVVGRSHDAVGTDTPRSAVTIGRSQLTAAAARSTPEVLRATPGVHVQQTSHGGGAPFIRGLGGKYVLIQLDGVPLNNSTTRFGPNQSLNTVDPSSLRAIEVLRGPGSIRYGSGAVGGVVSLLSQRTPLALGIDRLRWGGGGSALLRFDSADQSTVYHLDAWTRYRDFSVLLGGSLRDFNTLVGGRGVGAQPGTGYTEYDWNGVIRVPLARQWFLQAVVNSVRQHDVPRTDRFTPSDFRYYAKQYRDLAYVAVDGSAGRLLQHLRATASYHTFRELRQRFRIDRDRIERERDDVHVLGFAVRATTDLGRWSKLHYGVDLYHDWVTSYATNEGIASGVVTHMYAADGSFGGFRGRFIDGSRYLQGGVFLDDEIRFLPWLTGVFGGRLAFSRAWIPPDPLGPIFGFPQERIDATFVGPVFGGSLTFHVPVAKRLGQGGALEIITSAQQGYRAPNLYDYSHVGSEGPAFSLPNPDIGRAEKSTTLELGVRLRSRWISGFVFGHYSLLRDFIARRYTGAFVDGEPAAIRDNSARGYLAGVEAWIGARLPGGVSFSSWLSWTRGDLTIPIQVPATQPIRRVPPLQGQVTGRYTSSKRYWALLRLRWAAPQKRLSEGDRNDTRICPDGPDDCPGTPGFVTLSLAAGATLGPHVSVVLWINNVTNERYKFHGSGIYGAGLSASLELRVRL